MGRVFVAGSINMDVVATADRHPRIGETVAGTALLYFPGGKGANQAISAARLGAPTTLIGRLGKDAFGDRLKAFLGAQGVEAIMIPRASEESSGQTGRVSVQCSRPTSTIGASDDSSA